MTAMTHNVVQYLCKLKVLLPNSRVSIKTPLVWPVLPDEFLTPLIMSSDSSTWQCRLLHVAFIMWTCHQQCRRVQTTTTYTLRSHRTSGILASKMNARSSVLLPTSRIEHGMAWLPNIVRPFWEPRPSSAWHLSQTALRYMLQLSDYAHSTGISWTRPEYAQTPYESSASLIRQESENACIA